MSGNPREHVKDKGFWDGGAPGHGKNDQGSGRTGGYPGLRKPGRVGIKTDLEYPPADASEKDKPRT